MNKLEELRDDPKRPTAFRKEIGEYIAQRLQAADSRARAAEAVIAGNMTLGEIEQAGVNGSNLRASVEAEIHTMQDNKDA